MIRMMQMMMMIVMMMMMMKIMMMITKKVRYTRSRSVAQPIKPTSNHFKAMYYVLWYKSHTCICDGIMYCNTNHIHAYVTVVKGLKTFGPGKDFLRLVYTTNLLLPKITTSREINHLKYIFTSDFLFSNICQKVQIDCRFMCSLVDHFLRYFFN